MTERASRTGGESAGMMPGRFQNWQRSPAFSIAKRSFDLAVVRSGAPLFRENQSAFGNHVELTGLAGRFRRLHETIFE